MLGRTVIIEKLTGSTSEVIEDTKSAPPFTVTPLPENYIPQDFIKKPNVYLLGFDAMTPKNVVQKLLKLAPEETPSYFDVLEKNDMQIIPNVFSARPRTIASFSSMIALDMPWYTQIYGDDLYHGYQMLAGEQWTPTYDMFSRNGYELKIIYFDGTANKGVINKQVTTRSDKIGNDFCSYSIVKYILWGYCTVGNDDIYGDAFYLHMKAATSSKTPIFLHSYVHSPGHTGSVPDYDGSKKGDVEKYKAGYLKNTDYVAELLQKYIDVIISNDEDAIIIVFGDHGAHITLGARSDNSKYTEKDIVQDGHAVVLAVRDQHNGCQDKIAEPIVTTLPDMMHNLITCLTGGKPVLKDRYNSEPDFIDYLYDPIPNK